MDTDMPAPPGLPALPAPFVPEVLHRIMSSRWIGRGTLSNLRQAFVQLDVGAPGIGQERDTERIKR
jgi:hypothetical protein